MTMQHYQVGALCQSHPSPHSAFTSLTIWPSLSAFYLLMKLDLIQQQSISPAQEDKTSFIPSMASAQKHTGLTSTPGRHTWLFGSLLINIVQTNDITKGNVIGTHSRAFHSTVKKVCLPVGSRQIVEEVEGCCWARQAAERSKAKTSLLTGRAYFLRANEWKSKVGI